jgi:hypothetical protein
MTRAADNLTIRELANQIGVSDSRLRYWVDSGRVTATGPIRPGKRPAVTLTPAEQAKARQVAASGDLRRRQPKQPGSLTNLSDEDEARIQAVVNRCHQEGTLGPYSPWRGKQGLPYPDAGATLTDLPELTEPLDVDDFEPDAAELLAA